ncbi:MAG TPA: carboxypeptidase-like regulatory domain-containing protein, partial [Acidimicrobiia bacterium]|nr:carboxypeptidase-like regulatory domain-containing protein [Acidimicrobiia bacterium]
MPSKLPRLRFASLAALLVVSLLGGATPAQADSAGGELSGIVQDARGDALDDATITLVDGSGIVVASTTTNKNGRYAVAVAPGIYDLSAEAASGDPPVRVNVAGVVVGANTALDLVAVGRPDGLAQLRGRLLKTDGAPLADTTVRIAGDASTITDPDGRFVLGAPRGVYNLDIWTERLSINVADFDLTHDRSDDMSLPVVAYDVTLRDPSGAPLTDTRVDLAPTPKAAQGPRPIPTPVGDATWGTDGWTDSTGRVRLLGLETAKLTASVFRRGVSEPITFDFDGRSATSFEVTVPPIQPPTPTPTVRLSGTATDVDGIRPAFDSVTLATPDGTSYWGRRDYAAGDSAFSVDAPAGTYRLAVHSSLGSLDDWEGGDPEGDIYMFTSESFRHDVSRSVALRLPAGPGLSIRVLDSNGDPVPG